MLDLARDDGPRQVGRPRAERVADPPRIRRVNATLPLPDDDLWLVDDVVSTGATLDACAAVLRDAGATRDPRAHLRPRGFGWPKGPRCVKLIYRRELRKERT